MRPNTISNTGAIVTNAHQVEPLTLLLTNLADLIPHGQTKAALRGDPQVVLAATCGEVSITWTELDIRTRKLATGLHSIGIEPGDRVGIYLHKSIDSLVAVHGILRAGAVYVPLDPLAPSGLTTSVIEDCEISAVVANSLSIRRLNAVLTAKNSITVIGPKNSETVEETQTLSWDEIDALEPFTPISIDAADPAYILYTSGSTGKPKGILHSHRSGLAYARNAADLYGFTAEDRMASVAPLHFDMSTLEFFAGVLVGAELCLVPEQYLKIPASLSQLISDQKCTTIYAVPSLFQQLLDRGALQKRDLSNLRWVLHAGEVFPVEQLRTLMLQLPNAKFSNVYGPTETNQCSHFTISNVSELPSGGPLPIGKPWQKTSFAIVDETDRPVLPGEQGLLLVSSLTLMDGYWKQPDLTAAAFAEIEAAKTDWRQADPKPARWYRTGDVVSQRADGELIFYGRQDNQVQVRGHRVELETVESEVNDLDGIAQAVVGLRPQPSGDAQLVVTYQPTSTPGMEDHDEGDLIDTWRRQLRDKLPPYAIPQIFQATDSFPLTSSGKIDRRAVRQRISEANDDQQKSM